MHRGTPVVVAMEACNYELHLIRTATAATLIPGVGPGCGVDAWYTGVRVDRASDLRHSYGAPTRSLQTPSHPT